jgi:hypothetical protein
MKNPTKIAIFLLALAAMPFLAGCGPSMATTPITEASSSSTQTFSRQAVIVQPAPTVVSHSTTTTTTQTSN